MSRTIDERVVEMRFDNGQFERNVQTSMSTIEKLKQKLNFNGVGKGLENLGNAAKKVDMTSVSNSVDTLRLRFSALEVIGVTALVNIANAAMNTGVKIAKALTIDPIATGLSEYELQINSIQTILANTASKGTTLDQVNSALAELNTYADQTIYNFAQMTENIGRFTAAGVDLDTSVSSIKGLANLAAISGSSATQASTAMYQLSQAIAAGKVQLMDWNSVVNAGMGGEVFQNALKRTAEHFGTNVDAMIAKYGSFRESLTKGEWLTTEVLTETLAQLSGAYTEADLIAQGYTESQAREIVQLAETAKSAATDVKTFTQLMDTTKEAIQSGWAQTWQLIIGDFEEAKAMFSEMSGIFGEVIRGVSDARNNLLSGALDSNWDKLIKQINDAGIATEDFSNALSETAKENGVNVDSMIEQYGSLANAFKEGAISSDLIIDTIKKLAGVTNEAVGSTEDMTSKLEQFQKVVDEVWQGTYDVGEERIKKLTEAGYDYAKVQDLVNKTVDGHRLTLEDLGEEQLKSIGYTDEEITKLQELAKQAEETGTPLNELIENITKPSGRELLWDTVLTSLKSIISIGGAVGDALKDAFGDNITSEGLYNLIAGINQFSHMLAPTEEDLRKITSTFKGLFAIIDIFTTITGGALKIGLKALGTVLGNMDLSILDVTAAVGEAIASFRDWLFENNMVIKGLERLAEVAGNAIRVLIDSPLVQGIIQNIQNGFEQMVQVGRDAIEGLKQGLQEGIYSIPDILIEIGNALLNAIKGVLGIHSPSTEMHAIGVDTIDGFLNGLKEAAGKVFEFLRSFAERIKGFFGEVDLGKVIALGVSAILLKTLFDVSKTIGAVMAPLEGVGEVLSGFAKILRTIGRNIGHMIRAMAFKALTDGVLNLALAIGILAGSVFLLSKVDALSLWKAVGAIAALAGVITLLSVAVSKFSGVGALQMVGFGIAMTSMASSLLIAAAAIKILETMDPERMTQTLTAFMVMIGTLGTLIALFGVFVKGESAKNISKFGTMMLKLSISLLLMAAVVKIIGTMSPEELVKGGVAIGAFIVIMGLLGKISSMYDKNVSKLGSTMIKMAIAMGLMVVVIKMISDLSPEEILKGGLAIYGFVYVISVLSYIVDRYGKGKLGTLGATLLSISASMLILVGVVKLVSSLSPGEIAKGVIAIGAFTLIIAALVKITNTAKGVSPKIAATLLAMSVAIGILAGIAVVLSLIDLAGLAKGIVAVGLLTSFIAGLVYVTKYAKSIKGELLAIAVAIGVLATAVAALSFIDPAALARSTAALGILMVLFGGIVAVTSIAKPAMKELIAISAAIALLAELLILVAQLPIENALASSASLSILMISLTASMTIISKAGTMSTRAVVSMGAMVLALGGLSLIISYLSGIDSESALKIAISLSTLLLAFSASMAIMAAIGSAAPAALAGALALDGVILAIGGFMAAIGALATYFPALEEFLDKGIGLLEKIGYGLGNFLGSIVGGFAAGAMSGLPDIGTKLSEFMTNIQPFITGANSIDPAVAEGVKSLAQAILIITGANILESIGSWLTGGSSLTEFANQLVPFGQALSRFSIAIKDVDASAVTAAANAGKVLAEMAQSIPNAGGLIAKFTGENSLTAFANELLPFGQALSRFSVAIKDVDASAVTSAANAGQVLAQMADSIPNAGGLISKFVGENSLTAFANELVPFGQALSNFSVSIQGVDASAVTAAANAAMVITEMANTIPNAGGLISKFTGDNSLTIFAQQLEPFGTAMTNFSATLASFDPNAVNTVMQMCDVLLNLANTLPNTGGLVSFFTGDNDLASFGVNLVSFGNSFKAFADSVSGIDVGVVSAVAAISQTFGALQSALPNNGLFTNETWLDEFGDILVDFGKSFAEFADKVSEINISSITAMISSIGRLRDLISSLSGLDSSGIETFKTALDELGSVSVENLVNAYSGASTRVASAIGGMISSMIMTVNAGRALLTVAFTGLVDVMVMTLESGHSSFQSAGQNLMDGLISGIRGKIPNVDSMFRSIITSTANTIRSGYSTYRSAGSYLVQGLIDGINAKKADAVAAARSMAQAVEQATKAQLSIQSPSKVFFKIGDFIVQGLAKGMKDMTYKAVNSSKKVATDIVDTFQDVLKIDSPSKVTKDEVGRYIVEGIAEGITEDMSAEQAAAQKAQNIVNAFKTELDKIDMSVSIMDLEFDIWEGAFGGINDSATDAQRAQYLVEKYNALLEKVRLAQAEYAHTRNEFGEDSNEAIEAYKKFLQEQKTLLDLANQINDSDLGVTIDTVSIGQYLMGLTQGTTQGAVPYKKAGETAGEALTEGISTGVTNGTPQVNDSTVALSQAASTALENTASLWATAGSVLTDAIVAGMESNFAAAMDKAAEMGQKLRDAFAGPTSSSGSNSTFVPGSILSDSSIWEDTTSGNNSTQIKKGISSIASSIAETFKNAMTSEPTIKPVVDLSDVEKGVSKINTMFSNKQAITINSKMTESKTSGQNGVKTASGGTTVQFTQNNYSPKALSTIDIYRQTKNQISSAKGALSNA